LNYAEEGGAGEVLPVSASGGGLKELWRDEDREQVRSEADGDSETVSVPLMEGKSRRRSLTSLG